MKLLADCCRLWRFCGLQDGGLVLGHAVAIGLSVLFIALMRIKGQAIDRMQWISLALIVVFGGATLVLHDEQFIKLKPNHFSTVPSAWSFCCLSFWQSPGH